MNDETTQEATPRTDALWIESGLLPQTTTEKWLDANLRIMERELAETKANLSRAILLLEEEVAALCAIEASIPKPNSLQPKPLTAFQP